jgi:hypothetical protein
LQLGYNRAIDAVEIKRTISKVVYRIEPKPEGGFIARAADPGTPALEALTREELQEKIRTAIAATLAQEFPGLNLPPDNNGLKFSFHIEAKPGGGFVAHSTDPNQPTIEGATHEEVQHSVAEKLLGPLASRFLPEVSAALAKPISSGDINFVVKKNFTFTAKAGAQKLTAGADVAQSQNSDNVAELANNSPIVPSAAGNWRLFASLLVCVALVVVVYFLLHSH